MLAEPKTGEDPVHVLVEGGAYELGLELGGVGHHLARCEDANKRVVALLVM